MNLPRFVRPNGADVGSTENLYVANCGPAVGLSFGNIASVFCSFGDVKGVFAADDSGTRVIVSFTEKSSAEAALETLNGHPCHDLGGRFLQISYSMLQHPCKAKVLVPVSLSSFELDIPGIFLYRDFVSAREEKDLLASVDCRPWKSLSKRRVQHYGYEFCYRTRNINTKEYLGELPSFVSPVLERLLSFPYHGNPEDLKLDQLTVNEYPPGVGLSPHIDTHSAFEGLIFSLSLAGPCVMEFRRYPKGEWVPRHTSGSDTGVEDSECCTSVIRKALYLPPRSMLLLSGEGRYAWHHYIPHHKVDMVKDNKIRRNSRRVSFTLRKVRIGDCRCSYPECCDCER